MSRFTGFLIGFTLIVGACALGSCHANAQAVFNVQHDGVPQFCAPGIQVTGNVYNFVGTCNTPPPINPPGQLTRGNVTYIGGNGTAPNADLTNWSTVWGRINAALPGALWPSARGSTPQWVLPRTGYTCTKFRTTSGTGSNVLSMSSYNSASNVGVSVSRMCGDFSMPVGGCRKEGVSAFQASFFKYQGNAATTAYVCGVQINTDYYLNLHWTDGQPKEPGGSVVMCNAQGCKIAITSNTSPT